MMITSKYTKAAACSQLKGIRQPPFYSYKRCVFSIRYVFIVNAFFIKNVFVLKMYFIKYAFSSAKIKTFLVFVKF